LFKVDSQIIGHIIGIHFWKGLQSAGWSTQLCRSCEPHRYLSWFAQFRNGWAWRRRCRPNS